MFPSLILLLLFASCKKEENKVYFEGGTAPVLTSSVNGGTVPMTFLTKDNRAVKLSWTNPNYQFTTGASSHDVSYVVEIDTAGSNFTNPDKKVIGLTNDLSLDITQNSLNDYLMNQLLLAPGVPHNIEIRVKSTLEDGSVPLMSNVVKFTATPFTAPPKVDPPTNGTLWITGDAVAGAGYSAWSNPIPAPYDVNFQFTQVSSTVYELTLDMPGGGGYKLIQEQGDWSKQYHMTTGTWNAGDFEKKDSDPQFPGPPTAGTYKITVDFQRGKYTVVKL